MAAIPGTIDEWVQMPDGRWIRVVDGDWMEGDGVITLSPHMSFADYWKKRATETEQPARDLVAEIDDLKAKLAAQETKLTSLSTTGKLTNGTR